MSELKDYLLKTYKTYFHGKDCVIFDFDGVIIFSEKIRIDAFRYALRDYEENHVNKLIDFHRANGGLSRYVKFEFFFATILRLKEFNEVFIKSLQDYREYIDANLKNETLLNLEIIKLIIFLNSQGITLFIASGSDEKELRGLVKWFGIESYFAGVYGSPEHKNILVRKISKMQHNTEIVLVGDAVNDYEAAKLNGVEFIGYNNESLRSIGHYLEFSDGFV